jgi:uncharacterized surface protein with fasciclin (FAS1) repeats
MERRTALKLIAASAATPALTACATGSGPGTIVDVAAGTPDFSTLVSAVQAAGLADTLNGPGPFTVFAPTNAAFSALPGGTVDTLLLPENQAQLQSVLTYHVLPGAVTSDQIIGRRFSAQTVQGGSVTIDGNVGKVGTVRVNSANVILPDIFASNGVIHAIDRVLLP